VPIAKVYFKGVKGAIAPSLNPCLMNRLYVRYKFQIFECESFYNEIKLQVAVNIELGFLSGPYLVINQIKHKRYFQNTDRC
jgi:hypothetical protein